MTEKAIVNVSDVVSESVTVKARDLRIGDTLFDVYGGKHTVRSVRHLKNDYVSVKRDDLGFRERFNSGQDVTIIRHL